MPELAERLAARTLELVDIPSESRSEARIREHLLGLVPPSLALESSVDEAYFFVPVRREGSALITLAGHYDTVPAQGNVPGSRSADVVRGLGASDMKGGLAVAIELVRDLTAAPPQRHDVALLLFGREELPHEEDPLPALFAASEAINETDLAIVLEPTDGQIEAGCLGNVIARLTFHGTSGHSARPWLADSAIARAVAGLEPLLAHEPVAVDVDGLTFTETLAVTRLTAGIADNVIPGEATATLNLRYPPDRSPQVAEEGLRAVVPAGTELEIVSHAPAGRVAARSPLVAELATAGAGVSIRAKQAWTNVADFSAHGIDAVNFGPGDPAYAHRRDEQVRIGALVRAYETLARFVGATMREDVA